MGLGPWAFWPQPWGRPDSLVARRPRPGRRLRPDGHRLAGRAWRAGGRAQAEARRGSMLRVVERIVTALAA